MLTLSMASCMGPFSPPCMRSGVHAPRGATVTARLRSCREDDMPAVSDHTTTIYRDQNRHEKRARSASYLITARLARASHILQKEKGRDVPLTTSHETLPHLQAQRCHGKGLRAVQGSQCRCDEGNRQGRPGPRRLSTSNVLGMYILKDPRCSGQRCEHRHRSSDQRHGPTRIMCAHLMSGGNEGSPRAVAGLHEQRVSDSQVRGRSQLANMASCGQFIARGSAGSWARACSAAISLLPSSAVVAARPLARQPVLVLTSAAAGAACGAALLGTGGASGMQDPCEFYAPRPRCVLSLPDHPMPFLTRVLLHPCAQLCGADMTSALRRASGILVSTAALQCSPPRSCPWQLCRTNSVPTATLQVRTERSGRASQTRRRSHKSIGVAS